jgi:hypothetical protein
MLELQTNLYRYRKLNKHHRQWIAQLDRELDRPRWRRTLVRTRGLWLLG